MVSAETRAKGVIGLLLAGVQRGSTLRRVLKLEVDHQRKVLEAGGADAVARDPTRLWNLGLAHVRTARQADEAAKKAGGGGAEGVGAGHGPVLRDLLLVGGGHSHAHVLLMLGMEPIPGVRVTLVTRDMETPYSGMLPGHVAGHYTKRECHIDLARLGRFAGARVVHAEVTGIDVEQKRVHLRSCLDAAGQDDRPPLRYDVISVDVGCSPSVQGLSGYDVLRTGGVGQSVATVKPIDGFSRKFERMVAGVEGWKGPRDVVIVGAGAGGVELALAVQHRLQEALRSYGRPPDWARVAITSRSKRVMPNHASAVSGIMARTLQERGVRVYPEHEALRVEAQDSGGEALVCRTPGGEVRVGFGECVWCTDGAPQSWMRELGLETDTSGFLLVETTLQARLPSGQPLQNFFAAGDCASIRGHPRPKAGVFAVMAGMPLSKNLRAALEGGPLVEYIPQQEFLGIIGLGRGGAVASKGDVALKADWLWELKDWIDRTWMWKYTEGLPKMGGGSSEPSAVARQAGTEALELLKKASMRCGGCGSKVGSTVLSAAMQRVQAESQVYENSEVLVGMQSADDAAVVQQKGSKLVTVQTVDFFKSIVGDPYVFGRIAALHALSDCFSMGARAQTALALCTVTLGSEAVMQEDVFQMMAGANRELRASCCTLAGGHTTEGPEAGLGFCVTGVAGGPEELLTKGGLQPGDTLLLTKPLGTGCIFAAEMQQRAVGPSVSAALRSMLRSNEPAAQIVSKHGARACTDVTGFGLLGHLVEMCRAAGQAAVLRLDDVPALPGAEELLSQGVASSLQPANFRLRRALRNEGAAAAAFSGGRLPRYPLLYDPQTNGGLLLAVQQGAAASACAAALAAAGEDFWVIGSVVARPADWHEGQFVTLEAAALSSAP
mmetsp:Transcript_75697/g.233729  ORF Transcript_75697/g.233729 Transcript_75697/m.233729 type:complete len:893 (+) Transcript_75697:1-2679(+)